jgi:LPXTG-motif cell wall-anchored protein
MLETNTNGKRSQWMAAAILCAVTMTFTFLPKLSADDWDKKTVVTFGETVEIPGQALPAGTYVFKVQRNSLGNSHTVQIFDQNTQKLIATVNATPVYLDAWSFTREQPAIRLEERPSPEPEAIKIFRRPGDIVGQEFVYSKDQMKLLAQNSPWAIPGTTTPEVAQAEIPDASTAAEPAGPMVQAPDTSAEVTPSEPATNTDTQAAPTTPAEAAPEQAQPPATSNDTSSAPSDETQTLPKTGSELPLIGMMGSFSLGLGAFLSAYRRRERR